jgi:putative transposase
LLLGCTRQGYYQGIKYTQQKTYEADIIVAEVLKYRVLQKHIGARKLLGEMGVFLQKHGFQIGRDAFFKLLSDRGLLVVKRKRKGCITTFSRHRYKKYTNLIKGFIPLAANLLWVSDITYIHVGVGFAYLSLITDAYSHKIVGFCLYANLKSQGPLNALKMALDGAEDVSKLIHHSDRGVQYCCDEYIKLLEDNGVKISMTENGDPLENAVAERLNGILKKELLEHKYPNFATAQKAIAIAVSTYNFLRPHNSINNLKPVEAHLLTGEIPKKWKNNYQINNQKTPACSVGREEVILKK